MSCDVDCPATTMTVRVDHCTTTNSFPVVAVASVSPSVGWQCANPKIVAGASHTTTVVGDPASFIMINTPKTIRVRFNGGTEDFLVTKVFAATMEVSSVEVFNDQLTPPEDLAVEILLDTGPVL